MKNKILFAFIAILILGVSAFFIQKNFVPEDIEENQENISSNKIEDFFAQDAKIDWYFDMESKNWKVSGAPPECDEPLIFPSPADIKLASSILYPGQIRGGDYKPHGGIRFDGLENNGVDVYAPMDGNLFMAARHLESGEVQYSLYFTNDCGMLYKLDHLRELTSKFNSIMEKIPMGGEGDSRTTQIFPSIFVGKGEHVATKIGIEANKNIFFDFGVYDLRKTNGVVYDEEFRAKFYNIDQFGTHALCWLDYLEGEEKNIAKSLQGGDGISGKTSDYCD
ncbi:MAG: hypothetical protein AABX93_03160 [Nanoarchaeota archaeon]